MFFSYLSSRPRLILSVVMPNSLSVMLLIPSHHHLNHSDFPSAKAYIANPLLRRTEATGQIGCMGFLWKNLLINQLVAWV